MRFARPTAAVLFAAACLSAGAAFAQDPPAAPAAPAAPVAPALPDAPAVPVAPAAAPVVPVVKALPGGTSVSSAKTILENAGASRDLADFVAAVQGADLTATLSGPGPFTVFIPTRSGFDRLERGTLAGWMRPDGKRKLTSVVSYHVVNGALSSDALAAQVKAANGEAPLATVQGGYLTVKGGAKNLSLTDVNGSRARVIGEAQASNGVIFLIDNVMQP